MYPHQSERLTMALERAGADALVAASAANVAYVTGYRTPAPAVGVPGALLGVFTRRGTGLVAPAREAVAIALAEPAVDAVACHGVLGVEIGEAAADLGRRVARITGGTAGDAAEALVTVLRELGVEGAVVALDDVVLPASAHRRCLELLGAERVRSGADAFAVARAVKAPWEIECLQRGLGIAETAIAAVLDVLRPGLTEREAAARYEAEVVRAGAIPHRSGVAFGQGSAAPIVSPGERPLRRGDLVRFDVGCTWRGYFSGVARMAVLGEPDARQESVHEALDAGLDAATAALTRGGTADAVLAATAAAVQARGLTAFRPDDLGGGIGLEPDERPRLAPGDAAIEPGMVLRLQASYFELGWAGLQLSETVLVTRSGTSSLNRSRRGLIVLDQG